MAYTRNDIADALARLGVAPGGVVYVISALWKVPGLEGAAGDEIARAYFETIRDVLGPKGTIVVGTHSLNLCNTDIPFDPRTTPSYERGALSELVRQLPGAHRSFHPFASYAAAGPAAEFVTANAARAAYGPETPEARLVELGAVTLNIGVQPRIVTTVHHVEQVMSVPYRYSKEFMHPVVRGGETRVEPFYLYVWYRDIGLVSMRNRRLFDILEGRLEVREAPLGRGRLFAYPTADFYREACRIFARDLYVWCEQPPPVRPYRK